MTLRHDLVVLKDELLASGEQTLTLDRIADAIGARAVTDDEIGELLDELEAAGRTVGEALPSAREHLMRVLETARALKAELGRSPTSLEIGERSGLTPDAVRLALIFARILQR